MKKKLLDLNKKTDGERPGSGIRIKEISTREIAVIGLAVKLAHYNDYHSLWKDLLYGVDRIGQLSPQRSKDARELLETLHPGQTEHVDFKEMAYLDRIDTFDAGFFRISPKDAATLDPCQRLFLETAWQAVEDAGYGGNRTTGDRIGVFVGSGSASQYMEIAAQRLPQRVNTVFTGNVPSNLAGRISYLMDWHGPAALIDTACSSALVAVHQACRALRSNECRMALAGAVKIALTPLASEEKIEIESSDNRTHAFDEQSDGTGGGEGVLAILLKPLHQAIKDKDNIYAVIKGSAVNQDGNAAGITVPNADAQADVIRRAWKDADIDPVTISYIEAHGTGTTLGDPIEIDGITKAFEGLTDKKQFCALGAVKTNFGHLDNAAGLLGLVKAILCLRHRRIPPVVHFKTANPRIPFHQSPVFVPEGSMAWESSGSPLRCGVSSFGLSGINCHMIVEEAPQPAAVQDHEPSSNPPFMLVISGRDQQALDRYIEHYCFFLAANPVLDLNSLCITAAAGRGHYSHRLALIFDDREQLVPQLDRLTRNGWVQDVDDNIYYGSFTVIPDNAPSPGGGALTRSQWQTLNSEAADYLQSNPDKAAHDLTRIARWYVQGADIDWSILYRGSIHVTRKVSIPAYPFERRRCWLDVPQHARQPDRRPMAAAGPSSRYAGATGGPLVFLRRRLAETPNQTVYSIHLDANSFWPVKNHTVMGIPTLVGTAYYQLLFEAARLHGIEGPLSVHDLFIRQPLQVDTGQVREVIAIVNHHTPGTITVELTGKKDSKENSKEDNKEDNKEENSWHLFGTAQVARFTKTPPSTSDIHTGLKANEDDSSALAPEQTLNDPLNPVKAGPRWKCVKQVWRSHEDGIPVTLGYLELAPQFSDDIKEFTLHPAVLDAALHLGLEEFGFLPMTAPETAIFHPLPPKLYCLVKDISTNRTSDIRQFDILLSSPNGTVIAQWLGYTLKRLRQGSQGISCHYVRWQESPLPAETVRQENQENNEPVVLIVGGPADFREEISAGLRKRPGRTKVLETDMEKEREIIGMLETEQVTHLLFLEAMDVPAKDADIFLEQVFIHLFRLLRGIILQGVSHRIRVLTAGVQGCKVNGRESFLLPENALLAGLLKVVSLESPNLVCSYIDADRSMSAAALVDELFYSPGSIGTQGQLSSRAAIRQGKRFEEDVEPVTLTPANPSQPVIRPQGVYLITGGYGAMGLAFARYLTAEKPVRIALLGRSTHHSPEHEPIGSQIKRIQDQGSQVMRLTADVSDEESLTAALQEIRSKWGNINGIFHCAGIAGEGFLINKNEDAVHEVLKPKVTGTRLLDGLTRGDAPDFMVLCASMTGITGAPGQADYTAANAYLDAFAEFRTSQGLRTISIDWPAWLDQGMAVDHGQTAGPGIHTPDALTTLDRLLHRSQLPPSVMVVPDAASATQESQQQEAEPAAKPPLEVTPEGREDGSYSHAEQAIAVIWGQVLGYERINIYHNYYDLGGDSINALEIRNAIAKELKRDVSIADIFNHLTVARLAAHLDESEDTAGHDLPQLAAVEPREYYPVSAAQRRLYVFWKLAKDTTAYNLPTTLAIKGQADVERLEQSIRELIAYHETLRTSFEDRWGELVQVIARPADIDFKLTYKELAADRIESELKKFVQSFDLYRPPLFRAMLVLDRDNNRSVLIYDVHHIAADAMSLGILNSHLAGFYLSRPPGPPQIHYKDFAVWQEQLFQGGELEKQEQYWLSQFQTVPPLLDLPLDFPRPPVQTFAGDSVEFAVGPVRTEAVRSLASKLKTTPFNIFLSAWFILLHKASRNQDIVIAVADNGRVDPKLYDSAGMFINNLPIRAFPQPDKALSDFIKEINHLSLQSQANQQYPFDQLVNRLDLPRDLSRNPLTDIVFSYMNFEQHQKTGEAEAVFEPFAIKLKDSSKFDMSIFATDTRQDVVFAIEYYSAIFSAQRMQQLSRYYLHVLDGITAEPDSLTGDLPLMPADELQRLLEHWNSTSSDFPYQKTLDQLFNDQVNHTPGHMALIGPEPAENEDSAVHRSSNRSYNWSYKTYKELDRLSNQFARLLLEKGAGLESVIACKLGSSPHLIITILGILKAGAVYLPIDPAYPEERLQFVLKDSHAALFIDETGIHDGPGLGSGTIELQAPADPAAYIMYTSGSTGQPKGVVVPHRAAVRLVKNTNYIDITREDRIMQTGSPAFDATTFETWGALLNGAALLVPPDHAVTGAKMMKQLTHRFGITIMWLTSGLFNHLVQSDVTIFQPLHTLLVGGEKLSASHIQSLRDVYPAVTMLNGYGPTENTTFTTTYSIKHSWGGDIPIGKPVGNTTVYILDQWGKPLPPGIPGEICCGGQGLALGYLNQPELTASRFLPLAAKTLFEKRVLESQKGFIGLRPDERYPDTGNNGGVESPLEREGLRSGGVGSPLERGGPRSGGVCPDGNRTAEPVQTETRYYKTGDLGLWLPDGNIRFLGRLDQQVKIRGFRVELGEIEVQLLRHPDIDDAAVITWPTASGTLDLAAYIVSKQSITNTEVRRFLEEKLPNYMVPGHVIQLEKLPLTVQGKLDRRALPEPGQAVQADNRECVPAADELEEKLIGIWEQVLDLSPLGTTDNFFDRGGHSLKATQVISRVHRELGVDVSLKQLFMEPTVQGLARRVRELQGSSVSFIPAAEPAEHYPVSYAQQRLWILHQMKGAAIAYNIPALLDFYETIDSAALEQALKVLIQRHETLRTGFIKVKGELRQKIVTESEFKLKRVDLYSSGQGAHPESIHKRGQHLAELDFKTPFDLAEPPLLRATLIKTAEKVFVLLLTIHHIIADGWSLRVLLREMPILYQACLQDRSSPLPPLTIQYKDFVVWQRSRDFETQERYWTERLKGAPQTLALPYDFPPQEERDYSGDTYYSNLPAEITEPLRRLAKHVNTTFGSVYLSVFLFFLHWLTKQEDILVGMGIANRNHRELENLIGFFVNILPIRIRFFPDMEYEELLDQVVQACYDGFENQDYPFDLLVRKLNPKRIGNRQPMLNVMFEYQSFSDINIQWDGDVKPEEKRADDEPPPPHDQRPIEYDFKTSKFDITLFVIDQGGPVNLQMEYDTALFLPGTIERFMTYLKRFSEKIAEQVDELTRSTHGE